ncbi:hypothetical protein N7535_000997 [Penicillium sp. DV-2018c]|nr:hypothetical protein N7461_005760 [Penicillium sp. DV-2018c]KAJ5582377.1 hypothetical protein N7535_000997 [Penicillium sp. DV-2018c]
MMRKKEIYTNITPIPSCVPTQLALDILHSHSEIITLNPLVLSHKPIRAPRDAIADEYYSTWYEITEKVQYVPGLGKLGSGNISFKGCFQNEEWGLKTHMYAPMGIELQSKWRIGSFAGEGQRERDVVDGAPQSGLYIREEVQIECNRALVSYVKGQLKAASKVLVDRLIRKAELLDAGVLQGVVEDGKLMTFNPADLSDRVALQRGYSMHSMHSTQGGYDPMSRRLSARGMGSPVESPGPVSNAFVRSQFGMDRDRRESVAVELPGDSYHLAAGTEIHEMPGDDRPAISPRPRKGYGPPAYGGLDHTRSSEESRENREERLFYQPYRSPEKG